LEVEKRTNFIASKLLFIQNYYQMGVIMKKSLKLAMCLILVVVLFFTASCVLIPKSIQQIFTSPTPTSTNTPTPTATSTSTPTATSTPTNPLSVDTCDDSGNCWTSDWIDDLIEGGSVSGETYRLSIPYDRSERFLTGWTAIDESTLQENLTHIKWIFRIDGQDYFNSQMLSPGAIPDQEDSSIDRPGMWLDVSLSDWKLNNTHKIEIGYELASAANDGWKEYEAGSPIIYTYIITSSDLPTATPTETATLTPKPRPTAIPYTKTPRPTVAPTNPPCSIDSTIEIDNTTGGTVFIDLTGPMKFHFNLVTGHTSLNVCSGSYSYFARGCGGATDSGTLGSGEAHEFYCQ
jgi:hypothetical protein